jgi:hypothetical protein
VRSQHRCRRTAAERLRNKATRLAALDALERHATPIPQGRLPTCDPAAAGEGGAERSGAIRRTAR